MSRGHPCTFLVVVALAGVVGLAACGGGGSSSAKVATSGAAVKLIARSADATTAEKTARLSGSMSMHVRGQDVDVPFDGAIDFSTTAFVMRMDIGRVVPGLGRGAIEMRFVDGALYMDLGVIARAAGGSGVLPAGKSWMKLDLAALLGKAGSGDPLGQLDPTSTLDALRGMSNVTDLGHETIDGADTTHYRGDCDLQKALDAAPSELRDSLRSKLRQLGTGSVPVDVWLDAQGRLRRESVSLHTAKADVKVRIGFSDFGAPVDVKAPPADEVLDMGAQLGGLLGGRSTTTS